MADAAVATTYEQHADVGDPVEHHRVVPRTAYEAANREPLMCDRAPQSIPQPRRAENRGQFGHLFDLDRHATARSNGFDPSGDVAERLLQFAGVVRAYVERQFAQRRDYVDGARRNLQLADGAPQHGPFRAALLDHTDNLRSGGRSVVA